MNQECVLRKTLGLFRNDDKKRVIDAMHWMGCCFCSLQKIYFDLQLDDFDDEFVFLTEKERKKKRMKIVRIFHSFNAFAHEMSNAKHHNWSIFTFTENSFSSAQ